MGSRIDDRHTGYAYCIDSKTVFIILYEDRITMLASVTGYNMRISIRLYTISYDGKVFRTSGLSHQRSSLYIIILCVYTTRLY